MASTTSYETIDRQRRRFFGAAALGLTAAEFAPVWPAMAQDSGINLKTTPIGAGSTASFTSLKQVNAGVLDVGYAQAGPPDGPVVILLHGWPYDIHSYVDVARLLASQGYKVLVPYVRGCGATNFRSNATVRNGQPAALAVDTIAFMDELKIEKAIFGGYDWGGRTADIIAALWPARCKGLVSVSGYLLASRATNKMPLPPKAEYQWWYQYYFSTDRGMRGYAEYRHDFGKLIWQLASPKWNFEDATFDRTAISFNNSDYISIVIHNYRWRLSLAEGEAKYDGLEDKIAAAPMITIPTITLEGDANGAPHPDAADYAKKFSASMSIVLSPAALATTCPRKHRVLSRKPLSTLIGYRLARGLSDSSAPSISEPIFYRIPQARIT